MGRSQRRGALLLAALTVACIGLTGSAAAQAAGPTLLVTQATLRQTGDDLQFGLVFNRPVPVTQLQSQAGRVICVVLSPAESSRRSVCVSRRSGHLVATIGPVDAGFNRRGSSRVLRSARVSVDGAALRLRAPAQSLEVRLGSTVTWLAFVRFNDGGPCALALASDPAACTQRAPAIGGLALKTHTSRRPLFARRGRLRLLATGDSMIQYVDIKLAARLERRRKTHVSSDAHIATGITVPRGLNWVTRARRQANGRKPDVTVMFMGANDGYDLKPPSGARAPCCNDAWVAEYARRVQKMMRSYRRGGRSLVYWLTLPAPSKPTFAKVFGPVNEAIRRAAKRFDSGVHVVDVAKVFTPGGVFRKTMVVHGHRVTVRQADGVHLSIKGAAVAADVVIRRLRADHVLPRLR